MLCVHIYNAIDRQILTPQLLDKLLTGQENCHKKQIQTKTPEYICSLSCIKVWLVHRQIFVNLFAVDLVLDTSQYLLSKLSIEYMLDMFPTPQKPLSHLQKNLQIG